MRNLLDTFIALLLMSILIIGILSGVALVTPISSLASESIQYGLNTMTNYIRGSFYEISERVYTTVITAAYVVDMVLTALAGYKTYKKAKAREKAALSEEKTLEEYTEKIVESPKEGPIELGGPAVHVHNRYVALMLQGEVGPEIVERLTEKLVEEAAERELLKAAMKKIVRRTLLDFLFRKASLYTAKLTYDVLKGKYFGVVPHTFDKDETEIAAISGISDLMVKESLPKSIGNAYLDAIGWSIISTISLSIGLDLFMDFVVRDAMVKIFDVFYNPIFAYAEKKEDIFKRIDGCYKMFGSGSLKTQYLRPNPLLVYMISFYTKGKNEVPTVEDFRDYYTDKGYDFPLIICYEYMSDWKCSKIDNGSVYALEGYDNIKQNETLVKKFTISSIELCDDLGNCEQLLDKNGDGLVDSNEKISFYYATVVISYYQCIDWDSNTWEAPHSYFGPKISLSKWYGGLSYIVGPGIVQDVCKDRRPYIIVVFHNPNVNQDIKVELRREG